MSNLEDAKRKWEKQSLEPVINRFPERKERFETSSKIPIKRLYLPLEPAKDYQQQLGFPGSYPFTRGVQPKMYRSRYWTMCQYA